MWRTPWRAPSALRGGGRAVAPSKPLPRRLSSAVILRRAVRGLRTQRRPGRGYTPDVLFTPQAGTCTNEDPRNAGRELTLPKPPPAARAARSHAPAPRSEEHTSELKPLMRNSYAVFCLKKKTNESLENNKH